MTDLVVVSLEPWDDVWRRNQHLVAGLLRTDDHLRVLFVEPSRDPGHALRRRNLPRMGRGTRPGPTLSGVRPGQLWLHEPTKILPRRWSPSSDQRWARGLVRVATQLRMREPLLWVNSLQGAYLLRASRWRSMYDITDDWLVAERAPTEQRRLRDEEGYLLSTCRCVVVCSPRLAADKAHHDVTLIPNAVDLAAYGTRAARPRDLPEGPVVLYVGTVHADRFDVGLVEITAREIRDLARIVLVGPALLDRAETARLERAGVTMLGSRPFSQVPAYLQHADVLIVPHVVSAFTDSLDPIKVYEYQAAQRPVVSTPVAGFRDTDDPAVLAVDREVFAHEVRRVLEHPPSRLGGVAVPSWTDRVNQMRDVLRRVAAAPSG